LQTRKSVVRWYVILAAKPVQRRLGGVLGDPDDSRASPLVCFRSVVRGAQAVEGTVSREFRRVADRDRFPDARVDAARVDRRAGRFGRTGSDGATAHDGRTAFEVTMVRVPVRTTADRL